MTKQSADKILEALRDGKWHHIEEIREKAKIDEHKSKIITAFLKKFLFIETDKKGQRIKLNPSTKQFLDELGKMDPNPFYEEITA